MMHRIFIRGSLKINIFKVLFLGGRETNTWIMRHLLPNSYLVCDVLEEDGEREGCVIQLIQAAVDQRLVLKHIASLNIQKRHQCLTAPMSDLNGPFRIPDKLSCVVACFICLVICKVCTIMSKIESATGRGYTISV